MTVSLVLPSVVMCVCFDIVRGLAINVIVKVMNCVNEKKREFGSGIIPYVQCIIQFSLCNKRRH